MAIPKANVEPSDDFKAKMKGKMGNGVKVKVKAKGKVKPSKLASLLSGMNGQ